MSENETVSTESKPSLAPLYAALAKAQGEFLPIERDRKVKVTPKKKQNDDGTWWQPSPYTFDYATLEEVLKKCLPALNANGISLFHRLELDAGRLVTILSHDSGAVIEVCCPIGKGDWQSVGSAVTYARRYTVQCMLGVAAEFDDDGNAADGHEAEPQPKGARSPAKPTPATPQKPPQFKQSELVKDIQGKPETDPGPGALEGKAEEPAPRPKSVPPPLPTDGYVAPTTPIETKAAIKDSLRKLGLGSPEGLARKSVELMRKDPVDLTERELMMFHTLLRGEVLKLNAGAQ